MIYQKCWQPPYLYSSNPYPPAFQRCLEYLQEAVADESADEMFYNYLIQVAPNTQDQEIIATIRDDETKHSQMFRQIYQELTYQTPTPLVNEEFVEPASYCQGIQRALFGELAAVEFYRQIYNCLPTRRYRDMLFEIITDELKHAAKYNYLYANNNCQL